MSVLGATKKGLAAYREFRNVQKAVSNPSAPSPGEVVSFVAPGFAAYAASRIAARVAFRLTEAHRPHLAKHASAIASVAAFAATWHGVSRSESLVRYRDPLIMGAGIGAIAEVVRTYLPRYGWLFGTPYAPPAAPAQLPPSRPALPTKVAAATVSAPAATGQDDYDDYDDYDEMDALMAEVGGIYAK